MTAQIQPSAFADCARRALPPSMPRYAVSLINRQTGKPHRIADIPLRLLTSDPTDTCHDLMRGRDPRKWAAAIHRLDRQGAIS